MRLPDYIGVYGGGRMGAGIAHAFLLAGSEVRLIEVNDEACEAARIRVQQSLHQAQERGHLDEVGSVEDRLSVTRDVTSLGDCGLVIEAVPENRELKAAVLAEIEAIATHAVVATNTSSLSVDGLAATLRRPEHFLGLHFFNPVPASALVEIVVGAKTFKGLVSVARGWVDELGKSAVVVTDSPGFASSRLGVALALEAMRMLEDGVASAEDIDATMTLGYKHPVGPLRTTDIVGLDVRLAIAEHLRRELGPRFEPPRILVDYVAAGKLGRKAGEGFFAW